MSRIKDQHTVAEAWGYTGEDPASLFTELATIAEDLPWEVDSAVLDYDYFYNHSGDKPAAAGIEKSLIAADADELTEAQRTIYANIIISRYLSNWQKRWVALAAEYDPLENYSMTEDLSNDDTTITHGKTTTRTGSVELTPEVVNTVESSVYAYDSNSESPDAKTVSTPTGSNTTDYNDLQDAEGGTTKTEHGYTKTRSGNIGVTTSQQMLQAELDIRMYVFFNGVYADIDKIIACPIY